MIEIEPAITPQKAEQILKEMAKSSKNYKLTKAEQKKEKLSHKHL